MSERDDLYGAESSVQETMEIEQRLLQRGFGPLPDVLRMGGDFDFSNASSVETVVAEAQRYLAHQQTVELAGARVLAAIGEVAVKAQAYDAIVALLRARN